MATNYTQFVSTYLAAWTDNVPEGYMSSWRAGANKLTRYSVLRKGAQGLVLNSGQTSTVTIASQSQADWLYLAIRCVGTGHVNLVGKDASNATIASSIPVYGTQLLPGIVLISTYNLTAAPVIVSDQDGSTFDIIDSTCVEDGT